MGLTDEIRAGDQRIKLALCRQRMVAARRAIETAQAEFDEAFRAFESLTDEPLPFTAGQAVAS